VRNTPPWSAGPGLKQEIDLKKLHVAASPLTGTIFAGTVLKDGRTWGANKQDVTIEALVAVAEYALKFGHPVEICKADGTPEYRIMVEKLTPNAGVQANRRPNQP
jgi:hypothetical protein